MLSQAMVDKKKCFMQLRVNEISKALEQRMLDRIALCSVNLSILLLYWATLLISDKNGLQLFIFKFIVNY